MLHRGKTPGADVGGIGGGGVGDLAAEIGIALHEPRSEIAEQAEDIFRHQDLAVAGRRCADADGQDGDRRGDRRRHRLQGAFRTTAKAPASAIALGIARHLLRFFVGTAWSP